MKAFRVLATALLICLSVRVLTGCGGSGGPAPITGLTGSVEGYAFTRAGVVVLGNSATPPAGATVISGAQVTVDGRAGSVSTDATGRFVVPGVPIGQRTMHVAPPAGGAPTLDVPLTVLNAAAIQAGVFPVSRQQAIDAAKAAVAGTVADFRILTPAQPLPTGTVVSPTLGGDDALPNPALDYTTPSPQWLVYVDQAPDQRFQHPVTYAMVDAASGAVTLKSASSWPTINAASIYADYDKNETARDLVQPGTRKAIIGRAAEAIASARQIIQSTGRTRDHVEGATDPKTFALIIQGNSRSDMEADFDNVKANLFGPNGLSGPSDVREWSPPLTPITGAREQVKQLWNQICATARPQDTIFVYVSSHGSKSGAIYLQQGVESDESVTKDDYFFPFIDMDPAKCPACHVIFVVDACYAGSGMVDMAVKSPPHAGQKLTYIAASSSAETSGGISNTIRAKTGKTTGGVFTKEFMSSLASFRHANGSAGQANLKDIFDSAVTAMNSTIQHPQTVFKWDGTACGAPQTLVTATPTEVTAKHTVGTTPCPQNLTSISIHNETDETVSYSTSLNSSYFQLSGGSGSLSAHQTKSLGLNFTCGNLPPLTASIGFSASAGTKSQSFNIPITLGLGP